MGTLDEDRLSSPRFVKFRFGHNNILSAVAEEIDSTRPHILRLTIIRGTWHNLFRGIFLQLPLAVQYLLRAWWPGYFLPSTVILKKLKPEENDEDWSDQFQNEQRMYRLLKPLQGCVIPLYYGKTQCEGTPAHILSELRGVRPDKQKEPPLDIEVFRHRIREACRQLACFRVYQDDQKLSNVLLVDDRAMFVDLETVFEEENDGNLQRFSQWCAESLEERYANWLADRFDC